MKSIALSAFAACLVVSCAKAPGKIAATYTSESAYQNHTCEQLAAEVSRVSAELGPAIEQQTKIHNNDVAGMVMIGIPVASLKGPDRSVDIARLKGEQDALQRAVVVKGC